MAEQVALALRSHGRLIVEAGTGTGRRSPISCRRCFPAVASSSRRDAQSSGPVVPSRPADRRARDRTAGAGRVAEGARAIYLCLH